MPWADDAGCGGIAVTPHATLGENLAAVRTDVGDRVEAPVDIPDRNRLGANPGSRNLADARRVKRLGTGQSSFFRCPRRDQACRSTS